LGDQTLDTSSHEYSFLCNAITLSVSQVHCVCTDDALISDKKNTSVAL